ncbi:MAG: glycosyltransferase family 4 protein [Microcoleaceae cyanobacterium]
MNHNQLKVLLIIEQCNPGWASVPLVGYKFFQQISSGANVTLVTHERNKKNLSQIHPPDQIVYISESNSLKKYYRLIRKLTFKGRMNWPMYHTLMYPFYAEFNQKTYQQFKDKILNQEYDIVHAMTPMIPRYPVKLIEVCQHTPFILGPVNGGIPFPSGFKNKAKQESAELNFLKTIGRKLLPGYIETYRKADKVLMGSTYTFENIKNLFDLRDEQVQLFYENGIDQEFLSSFTKSQSLNSQKINLLFVGRLVPYKCADILIEAVNQLKPSIKQQVQLTIVGDGSEKASLEKQVQDLNLNQIITFTGWIEQKQTLNYYREADLFCFPSIREFGGAVVLEAMACGLPCVVVDYGGIGEYVTAETGFKIEPLSRNYLRQELTEKIELLVENSPLRQQMSKKAKERVQEFTWENKAQKIIELYHSIRSKDQVLFPKAVTFKSVVQPISHI